MISAKTYNSDYEKAIEFGYNKALDELVEAFLIKATEVSAKAVFEGGLIGDVLTLDCVSDMIVETAEQMRKGEKGKYDEQTKM